MGVMARVSVQVEAAFRAREPAQAEEVSTVRVILVTKEDIISNPTRVISSSNPVIRATQSS